jgi:hypothetical protein
MPQPFSNGAVATEAAGFDEATRAGNHTNKCARSNGATTPPP